MIKNVRVSAAAVREFGHAIKAIENYSPKLSKCVSWLNDCIQYISQEIMAYKASIEELRNSRVLLEEKKKGIEYQIEDLLGDLDALEDELDSLEEDLDNTPETITVIEDDEEREVDNPEYEDIEDEINEIRGEMQEKESLLESLRDRINCVYSVMDNIYAMEASVSETVGSLEDIKDECRSEIEKVENIIKKSIRNSEIAGKKTKRIEEIIGEYFRIKMKYDGLVHESEESRINAANRAEKESNRQYSKEEIKEHAIKINQDGRVISYDGKSFGGDYNTYEKRLNGTMVTDNPILGYYEGERGESKYIPSDRSAEGVFVIELLQKYNVDGIEYRNAEPDFEVCSEAVVCIDSMTKERNNYYDSFGIPKLGNFAQADIQCAKLWNEQKRDGRTDWDGREVKKYRKKLGLTWHEKSDTKTMVMVKSEINLFFSHTGGCSECRVRDEGISKNLTEESIFDE